ncbi:MAG: ImmA/IrrE family metallo-endopeptidase [Acidimicrobiia bacterium]
MAHGSHEERLAAAHATLHDAVIQVSSGEDWQNLLTMASSFHRYSPNNQLLLAAQGAQGLVASFHTWKQITSVDGEPCRIRKGETALRVYAPIRAKRAELDPDTGLPTQPSVVGYRLVPVFHQGQLVSPPDFPAEPKLLAGEDPPPELWDAVAEQIHAAGFTLSRGPLDGPDGPKGITKFIEKAVIVRDDLPPAQALKTELHELGHVLMHSSFPCEPGQGRDRIEVEAESVAYVVCDLLGVDAGEYSIPYVASWAGGQADKVQETAQAVLATARKIVAGLEAELGVDLRPNPIAEIVAMRQHQHRPTEHAADQPPSPVSQREARRVARGSADEIISRHLAEGTLDWPHLANSLPGLHEDAAKVRNADGNPGAQAILLAYAGASAEANVAVMRAHGLDDHDVRSNLTVSFLDSLGQYGPLYHPTEVAQALEAPRPVKACASELVADLIVAVGHHPAAVHQLVETSDVPDNVVSLVEERLKRACHPSTVGKERRADRGLRLIDEWSGAEPRSLEPTGLAPGEPIDPPEPPMPPVPAA